MKMYVFMPYDKSWKVSYLTNGVGTNDRLFINEIKSEKNGVVTPGLIAEAQALGLPGDYLEITVQTLIAKATDLDIELTVFEDRHAAVVLVEANNPTGRILTYSIPNATEAVIDQTAGTIALTVPFGTNLAALVATFTTTEGIASIKIGSTPQVSGETANNFAAPKTYVVTAEDEETTKSYVVTVSVAANTDNDFLTFGFLDADNTALAADVVGTVNINNTVTLEVPFGTDVTALIADFTVSPNATVVIGMAPQVSGETANNFTAPVLYTVSSESGSDQAWQVTVTIAAK